MAHACQWAAAHFGEVIALTYTHAGHTLLDSPPDCIARCTGLRHTCMQSVARPTHAALAPAGGRGVQHSPACTIVIDALATLIGTPAPSLQVLPWRKYLSITAAAPLHHVCHSLLEAGATHCRRQMLATRDPPTHLRALLLSSRTMSSILLAMHRCLTAFLFFRRPLSPLSLNSLAE